MFIFVFEAERNTQEPTIRLIYLLIHRHQQLVSHYLDTLFYYCNRFNYASCKVVLNFLFMNLFSKYLLDTFFVQSTIPGVLVIIKKYFRYSLPTFENFTA